jgi:16S rRNA (guanine527-N7)-methyltransferase
LETELIVKYFPEIEEEKIEQFKELKSLFGFWNEKINLISRKDFDSFYEKHVLHSLAIAKAYPFLPNQKIMDIGTGGGFPGLPLAIFYPETHFTLVDSIGKKIMVIDEIAQSLNLENIITINDRAENVNDKFHYVTNRAVAPLIKLWSWTKGKYLDSSKFKGGLISLKGGDLNEEIINAKKQVEQTEIKTFFDEPFFETKKVLFIRV